MSDTEPFVSSLQTERSVSGVAAAARVGGLVVALGYLTGLVGGPLVAPIGGLALITFGRCLRMERAEQALAAMGFAAIASGIGISALRWGTLDLGELRAVQAVLGPTLLVGPEMTAAAVIAAAGASCVALVLWTTAPPARGIVGWTWAGVESLAVALALVTTFWGPKLLVGSPEIASSEVLESVGAWAAVTAAVTLAGLGGGRLARMLALPARMALMIAALLMIAVAGGIVGSSQ